jgi:hypothetical protein
MERSSAATLSLMMLWLAGPSLLFPLPAMMQTLAGSAASGPLPPAATSLSLRSGQGWQSRGQGATERHEIASMCSCML